MKTPQVQLPLPTVPVDRMMGMLPNKIMQLPDKSSDLSFAPSLISLCCYFVTIAVIFLAIKPTPVTGIVPKAKKYVFFPIEANKFPK